MVMWIILLASIGEPGPPVVGRPVDFSGAIGGPFVVQWFVDRTEVIAEQPLTLTFRVTGPGNLAEIARPALAKSDAFKQFAVDNLDESFAPGDPPRREFRYRVRPRSADVKVIPRLKFVYFNPRIVPSSRAFQTTYAESIPLNVKPRALPVANGVPADVPGWMLEPPASDELFGSEPKPWQEWLTGLWKKLGFESAESAGDAVWFVIAAAMLFPPGVCGLVFVVWRRMNPDAARLSTGRRSRAAAIALRELRRSGNDPGGTIAAALTGYLRDRVGVPPVATTSAEIVDALSSLDCPMEMTAKTSALLRRCDAARFSPTATEDATLAADAAKIILEWEAAAWAAPGC